jgi:hypothetical protein
MDRNEIGAKVRQRQDQREERASEERKRMQDRNEEQRNEGRSEEEGERGKSTDSRFRIWIPQGRMRRVCARERYEARGVCRVSAEAEARKN